MNETSALHQEEALPSVIQMVLLKEPLLLGEGDLEKHLKGKFSGLSVSAGSNGDGAFIVEWGAMVFTIMVVNNPIPAETFSMALKTSYGLKSGEKLVAAHKAHLIISPLTPAHHPAEAASVSGNLMELTKAITSLGSALGYFWSSSETLLDQPQFDKALSSVNLAMDMHARQEPGGAKELPSTYWVGIRLFSPDRKTLFGAVTKGFESFAGYELEVRPLKWPPKEVAQRIYGTIAYLFSVGPVLKDGQTLGVSDTEHFRIREQAATQTLPRRLVLTLESSE